MDDLDSLFSGSIADNSSPAIATATQDFSTSFNGTIADPGLTASLSSSPVSAAATNDTVSLFGGLDNFLSSLESVASGAATTYNSVNTALGGTTTAAAAAKTTTATTIGGLTPTQLLLGVGLLAVVAFVAFRH